MPLSKPGSLQSAISQDADVVIIDTAGRLHNKVNLMNELSKIKRVMEKVVENKPDEVLLVLDGSTGQNAFDQAKQFRVPSSGTFLPIICLYFQSRRNVERKVSS